MKNQKFSVAMSVYKNDNSQYFARALQSITVDQTLKPDEVVLVVDVPVGENINAIIEDYSSECDIFKVIRLKKKRRFGKRTENCC